MRTLPLLFGVSSLLLAACGDNGGKAQDAGPQDGITIHDTTPTPDAPPIDADPSLSFSCYQNTAPTTAAATISISGQAAEFTAGGASPVSGAAVKACKGDCVDTNQLAMTDSAANGNYSLDNIATGGTPLAAYVSVMATSTPSKTYLKTLVFPHAPLAANLTGAPALVFAQQTLDQLASFGIVGDQDPANGIIGLRVTDCAAKGIIGVQVKVTKAGAQVGDDAFDVGGLVGGQAAGFYLMTNVPPGDVVIEVTYAGMTFLANPAKTEANTVTVAEIQPGY